MAARRRSPAPRQESWQIDRHIPVSLIVVFLLQTIGAAWWAATMDRRVTDLERVTTTVQPATERITRLEEKMVGIKDGLDEIKTLIRTAWRPTQTQ